jgi:hypothetical protein
LALLCSAGVGGEGDPSADEFFEARIRPVLVEHCYRCHSKGAEKLKGNLHLDTRAGLLQGGESGVVIVPGHPEKSRLIEAIHYENPNLQMPPKGKLSDAQIADLETWVKMEAPWPDQSTVGSPAANLAAFDLEGRRQRHWAWHPIRPVAPPAVNDGAWVRNSVDQFILARLERRQLHAAPPADRRVLLRRVYFDLIGLPPTPAETEAFLKDSSANAYEKVVNRLLASPAFGERWARHWLDLVRYAETLGHEFDYPNANAWRYRDYVIRALNADVPYNQFVMEHLAGDLLPEPRRDPANGWNESVIGTAFYWLGQRDHSPVDVRQHQAEVIDNQIDVLGKAFLGLTVACARCHDHKFDAISSRDYYALYGILSSSRYDQANLEPRARLAGTIDQLKNLKRRLRQAIGTAWLVQAHEAAQRLSESAACLASKALGLTARGGDVVFADAANEHQDWTGWSSEGEGFSALPTRAGDFGVGDATHPVQRILTSATFDSSILSRRLQGTLRSPGFVISHRFIHILAAGREARINVPVDNFTMIRDPIYGALKQVLDSDQYRWISIDVSMWKGHRAYLEFSDISAPDPGDDGHRAGFAPDGWLAVRGVLFSDLAEPPEPRPVEWRLPDPGAAAAAEDPVAVYEPAVRDAVQAWLDDEGRSVTSAQAALLDWLVANDGLRSSPNSEGSQLATDYRELERSIPDLVRVPSMVDGPGEDEHVFVRGSRKIRGGKAPRRFLEAIAGPDQPPVGEGSGRLELAQRMTSRANPFLARVMVNRVWLHLFGRGLVPTPDDFGALGQPPSDPELLDWLAEWYRTDGRWSTKSLIRMLVTSSTYRMDSRARDAAAEEVDPENQLWHRMPVRRLEGEAIRDAILAVSGHLDRTLFGPPVPIYLTEFMEGRGRPATSGPLDEAGRRSIYIEVRRNFVSPMMRAFDMPVPFSTVGRRTVSNVPAQSLILMNDPFVRAEARRWAETALLRQRCSTDQVIQHLYESALARPPSAKALEEARSFIERQSAAYVADPATEADKLATWADLCQVLFNVKEFIFIN